MSRTQDFERVVFVSLLYQVYAHAVSPMYLVYFVRRTSMEILRASEASSVYLPYVVACMVSSRIFVLFADEACAACTVLFV